MSFPPGLGQRVKADSPVVHLQQSTGKGFTFRIKKAGVRRGLEIAAETQAVPALRSVDLLSKTFLLWSKNTDHDYVFRDVLSFCNNDG